MVYQISNELLTLAIDGTGGAMQHMVFDGQEYLWQGDPTYWREQAPHLFPIIGRLTKGRCTMEGDPVALDVHGFFRRRPMELAAREADRLTLVQTWDAETYAAYPRKWRVLLTYALEGSTVRITFRVENLDDKRLYFYYGGHPGFKLPLEAGLAFEDYCVQFPAGARLRQRPVTSAGFMTGEAPDYPLEHNQLRLRRNLFDCDAVILEGTGGEATLLAPGHRRQITVSYPQMRYLGIWQPAGTDAPFLCLEPWCALPDRQDQTTELSEKEDVSRLEPGAAYENTWSVTLR